jgi:hypothetical protein
MGRGRARQKNCNDNFKLGSYNICTLNSEIKPNGAVGGVKGEKKHKTRPSQVVCDQSTVGKIVLLKNGGNAQLRLKLPTTHGQKWSSETPCKSACGRKIQGVANGRQIFAA